MKSPENVPCEKSVENKERRDTKKTIEKKNKKEVIRKGALCWE